MNYKKVYERIIENRLKNPLSESEYGEKHHIVPKCLGGSNKKENIVRLTAREHFICHALLAEMYEYESVEWVKMNYSFKLMKVNSSNQNRYINSRLYELKRKDFSKAHSLSQSGEGNSQYGKPKSEEQKRMISNTLRSKYSDKLSWIERNENRRLKHKNEIERKREYYNDLYRSYKESEFKSLNEFVKLTDYPFSLVNLVKAFIRYVDGYEKTQGVAK